MGGVDPRTSTHFWTHGRLLAGSYKTPITIQCNSADECDSINAKLKDPTFTTAVATSAGISPSAFKSVSEPQMYDTVAFTNAVTTIHAPGTNTHTTSNVITQADANKWKNATVALAVICVLLLFAVIGLAANKASSGGNSDAVKANDVEQALGDDTYTV
jgi:hypothetical protein